MTQENIMKEYIKTEIVKAEKMTYGDYLKVMNSELKNFACPRETEGYGIFKIIGDSLISSQAVLFDWLTTDEFNANYQETKRMTFGDAIEAMKAGHKVARKGWNGKGMYCIYVHGSKVELKEGTPIL